MGAKWFNDPNYYWDSKWVPADPTVTDVYQACQEKPSCPLDSNSTFNHTSGKCECNDRYIGGLTFSESTKMWIGSCTVAACPPMSVSSVGPSCRCPAGYVETAENYLRWHRPTKTWKGKCEMRAMCPNHTKTADWDPNWCACGHGFEGYVDYNYNNNTWSNHCTKKTCPAGSGMVLTDDPMTGTLYCKCPPANPVRCMNYTSYPATEYCSADVNGCQY